MEECNSCKKRGKTWNGADPKCAFKSKNFSTDNWNCATANNLRDSVRDYTIYNEEQNCSMVIFDECTYLIVSWYKERGRVEGAWIVDSEVVRPITLDEAENYLKGELESF